MPRHTQFRLLVLAAGIAIVLAYLAGGAHGVGTGDRDIVFSPATEPRLQVALPAADVPVGSPPTASALAARGSLAVALGRRSALRDFAAVSSALAAVTFVAALHAAGVPPFPALVTMLGMSVGAAFWSRGVSYTPDALSPALLLLATWAMLRYQQTRRRWMVLIAGVALLLAIFDAAPSISTLTLSTLPAPGFVSALTREFTPLGFFFAATGLLVLLHDPTTRWRAAALAVVLIASHAAWRSALSPVRWAVVVAGWWSIAVALAWLYSTAPRRSRSLIIAAVAVVLIAAPALTRMRVSALGGDLASEQRERAAHEFPVGEAAGDLMVVAESRRADAALLLSFRLASRPLTMVPQAEDSVGDALASGRPVIAFEHARANLERLGFLFERRFAGNVAVASVAGRVPCVALDADTWPDVSLLLANGSFTVHGAPAAAPAGVVVRMIGAAPATVSAIEPRSIPYEISSVAEDTEGVPELRKVASRAGGGTVTSIRLPATGRPLPVTVAFASAPAYAVATAEDPVPTKLCAGVPGSGLDLGGGAGATAAVRMNHHSPFGSGWHPVEADPDFFRWTGAPDASVRVTAAQPTAVRVTITATPAAVTQQNPLIGLTVNHCRLATQPMPGGQGDYEWRVEQTCWLPGVNQLWIHTSPLISPASFSATHDTRLLGARIGAIRLTRVE